MKPPIEGHGSRKGAASPIAKRTSNSNTEKAQVRFEPIHTASVLGEAKPYVIYGIKTLDQLEASGHQIVDENGNWTGILAEPGRVIHHPCQSHEEVRDIVIALNLSSDRRGGGQMSSKADRDKLDAEAEKLRKLRKESAAKARHELEPLDVHPLAKLVPEMSAKEYEEFRRDVEQNGLSHPVITLYEGKILDGRHRDRVCRELGLPRKFETYTGTDPAGFIISENVMRRQLTDDQRGALVTELRKSDLQAEARERKKASQFVAKSPNDSPSETTVGSKSPPPRGKVADKIAAEAKVSQHKARKLIKLRPEQLTQVRKGEKRLRDIDFTKPARSKKPKHAVTVKGSDLAGVFGEPFENEVWRRFGNLLKTIALGRRKDAMAFLLRQLQKQKGWVTIEW
jgi:hypothetical protein